MKTIINKLRKATTNSTIEIVWLSETISCFSVYDLAQAILVVTEMSFVITTERLGNIAPRKAAEMIPTM